jgi:coatomer subunit beta'
MVRKLAKTAEDMQKFNIAFTSYYLLKDLEKCLEILIKSDRLPEAAFFAR